MVCKDFIDLFNVNMIFCIFLRNMVNICNWSIVRYRFVLEVSFPFTRASFSVSVKLTVPIWFDPEHDPDHYL